MNLEISAIKQMDFNIDPHTLLDMILNDIRNETITFSTAKKRLLKMNFLIILNPYKIKLLKVHFTPLFSKS